MVVGCLPLLYALSVGLVCVLLVRKIIPAQACEAYLSLGWFVEMADFCAHFVRNSLLCAIASMRERSPWLLVLVCARMRVISRRSE